MRSAVRFEGVTKRYVRGGPRYASLRYDLAGTVRRIGQRLYGQERKPRGTLALDDVSFEVQEGESFAIVGPNGAGKSTALKLVSRILYPTSGRIRVRGRVAALIEVGSGVHPELTARENIWIYGQILGMSKAGIRRRFDEIVDFAELDHVLDTPVKMYSSGMQLRLGFSIASHLDPDVFVIDEALAVGDAGFQAKCVDRMMRFTADGRTILFVSHNLYAVETLCPKGILLDEGKIRAIGATKTILATYLAQVTHHALATSNRQRVQSAECLKVRVWAEGPDGDAKLQTGQPLRIICEYECDEPGLAVLFHYGVSDGRAGNLFLASQVMEGMESFTLGRRGRVVCVVPAAPLLPRVYEVWGEVRLKAGWGNLVDWQPLCRFVVEYSDGVAASVSHAWSDAPIRATARFEHTSGEAG
jgi:ABC-type polysaccharide/polyol phosphate transport system ATPase subunit